MKQIDSVGDVGEAINTEQKSIEQVQAENILDAAIPDSSQQEADTQEPVSGNATDSLYGLLSLIPIGLNLAGLKNTAAVWNDGVCRGIASAAVPVLRKYAFGQRIINFLETGAGIEEMALAAALLPVGLASMQAYTLDIEAREKEVKDATDDATN